MFTYYFNHLIFLQIDFQICFTKFDPSGRESVETGDVGSLVRATGLNPTMVEVTKIEKWLQESSLFIFFDLNHLG